MKTTIITLLISLFTCQAKAQDFEVPKDYVLESAADYEKYEDAVLDCVDWLMETPANDDLVKRKAANRFLLAWVTGSPNITITLSADVLPYLKTSPGMLLVYFGGWVKHALEEKDYDNAIAGSLAGTEWVLDFYTKNRSMLSKDKNIEKLLKLREKGKLKSFIESNS
ncbi:MAG: hypothetical protein ACI9JN_000339 [Bacteroidia bacterium]|jgi:hypothetical protein